MALIEISSFTQQDYTRLVEWDALAQTELIFLSHGEPNEFIDKAMFKGVGYHFRRPYGISIIEETIDDIFEDLTDSEPKAAWVSHSAAFSGANTFSEAGLTSIVNVSAE